MSCIEPLRELEQGTGQLSQLSQLEQGTGQARAVSWEDTNKAGGVARKANSSKEANKVPQTKAGDRGKESRKTEDDKLREMISIRRGSTQSDQKPQDHSDVTAKGYPRGGQASQTGAEDRGYPRGGQASQPGAEAGVKSNEREKSESGGRGGVKMTDGPRPRPLLQRGSSCNPQQALKTSQRPPLSRGWSVQARRNPAIMITRPHSTIEDGQHRPKINILEAVSEIHDNFKDNTRAYDEDFTEEETEDEFHEQLQGDAVTKLSQLEQLQGDAPHTQLTRLRMR